MYLLFRLNVEILQIYSVASFAKNTNKGKEIGISDKYILKILGI